MSLAELGWRGALVLFVFSALVLAYSVVTRPWEYRAVYHFDCASYMTES